MGDTAIRGVWITRSGVLVFITIILLTSAGMMWNPVRVSCGGGGRDDCEVARTQALIGINGRDLSGWDGEQRGLGVEDSGSRGIVVVVLTSL